MMRKTESITFSARSFFLSLCSLPFFILFISFFLISAEKKNGTYTKALALAHDPRTF